MSSRYAHEVYHGRSASAHPPYSYQAGGARSDLTRRNLQGHNNYTAQQQASRDQGYDDPRARHRRRSSSRSDSSSPPRQRHRSRDNRKRRRARSEDDTPRNRRRSGEDFVDKNFDKSFNGLLAAAAGAGVGAFAARRAGGHNPYEHKEDSTWRSIGGATAGAALGNAATKRFSTWRESEKAERRSSSRPQ